jgi:hypothetical protein
VLPCNLHALHPQERLEALQQYISAFQYNFIPGCGIGMVSASTVMVARLSHSPDLHCTLDLSYCHATSRCAHTTAYSS